MSMRRTYFTLMFLLAVSFLACNELPNDAVSGVNLTKTLFTGSVEKGPFVMGSSVTIFELDSTLAQTGKAFSTTIADNMGGFEQRNLNLSSHYVELKADGYYFNEVEGVVTESPITLYSIADINEVNSVNVNVLTTIERRRILHLVGNNGLSFENAREQAHKEVLAIFGMENVHIGNSEQLRLDTDAQLLVISSLIQGFRTTSEVSFLLASLADDISKDGTVENKELLSDLMNGINGLSAYELVANLEKQQVSARYSAADVQRWFDVFLQNTSYEQSERVIYPPTAYGIVNALNPEVTQLSMSVRGVDFVLAANTPKWASLKVDVCCKLDFFYEGLPFYPINFSVSDVKKDPDGMRIQTYTVKDPGSESVVKMKMYSEEPCSMTFLIYECDDSEPTRTHTIEFVM